MYAHCLAVRIMSRGVEGLMSVPLAPFLFVLALAALAADLLVIVWARTSPTMPRPAHVTAAWRWTPPCPGAEEADPAVFVAPDYVMQARVSVMLRGVSNAFGIDLHVTDYWRPHAEALLRQYDVPFKAKPVGQPASSLTWEPAPAAVAAAATAAQ